MILKTNLLRQMLLRQIFQDKCFSRQIPNYPNPKTRNLLEQNMTQ